MAPWKITRSYRDRWGRIWLIELLNSPGIWRAYTYAGALRKAAKEHSKTIPSWIGDL